ncbi:unnamed protein product, partial [Didymodactylos carnosus]
PLSDECIRYAREDTHYLLYIYDILRNRLLDVRQQKSTLLKQVFLKSKIVCQKLYKKPQFDQDGYQTIYLKSRKTFNVRQLAALKSLYYWRDKLARQEDESTGYVLPNHMLLQISDILPREAQGIRACCNPVPVLVQQNLHDIHQIILQAKDIQLQTEEKEHIVPLTLPPVYDPENVLNCPHDLSHQGDHLPSTNTFTHIQSDNIQAKPQISYSTNLNDILEETFKEQIRERNTSVKYPIEIVMKSEKNIEDDRSQTRINPFASYLPKSLRRSEEIKPIWKIFYPKADIELNGSATTQDNVHNGNAKSYDENGDVEMIYLSQQQSRKRKRNKDRQPRKKPRVAATTMNDDDAIEEGEINNDEIIEQEGETTIQPFDYSAVDSGILFERKFKRPDDNEAIYDPNKQKKPKGKKNFRSKPSAAAHPQQTKSMTYPFPRKTT